MMKTINREILLSFWKVHILHHAGEAPVHGQWILTELRRHGYEISPGTLYPLLERMERRGWLRHRRNGRVGPRARSCSESWSPRSAWAPATRFRRQPR